MDSRLSLEGMMTPAPYCIHPDTNVVEAKKEMEHRNVRHLPVRDGDTILGILSQRDVALSLSLAKHITDEASIRVADVCG
ncbi:MAG: CBS domain-containing protein, partial [Bdellovibrionales bacterium]|nr:CBS domain-containing protein [Bdellovibrionales bacterium]